MESSVDYGALRFVFDVLQAIALAAVAVYAYLVNRTKANRAAIDRVDLRVHDLSHRVTSLERDVRHLPNHQDMAALHEKVNLISNHLSTMAGEFSGVRNTLDVIHRIMLDEKE